MQAVQQEMGERLMNLREDMQASQQHITQQFAQHQVQLLCIRDCTVMFDLLCRPLVLTSLPVPQSKQYGWSHSSTLA